MTLRESKQLIRRWISERFSDERLAEVYAFNQDGRMRFLDPCGCLLGVTGSHALHQSNGKCDQQHYRDLYTEKLAINVGYAYNLLGYFNALGGFCGDDLRRIRLGAILRAQMRIRARQRQPKAGTVEAELAAQRSASAL